MTPGLRTHALRAHDLGEATTWYREALGREPYFASEHYVGFDVGGYELGIEPAAPGEPVVAGSATAYWGCEDVAAELARLTALGAALQQPATDVGDGIVIGAVRDPFGNALGFIHNPHFFPPLATAHAGDVDARAIVETRQVALPGPEVWRLWTTSTGMAEWLVRSSRITLRPGGPFELHFDDGGAPGFRGSEGCCVLSYVPGRMLSFTWNAPPHLQRTRRERTWVVVELRETDGGCEVTVTHTGWPAGATGSDPQWQDTYAYFERAWPRVMDRLVERGRQGPLDDV